MTYREDPYPILPGCTVNMRWCDDRSSPLDRELGVGETWARRQSGELPSHCRADERAVDLCLRRFDERTHHQVPEPILVSDIIAYSGSFSVEGGKVLHHIKVSPYPKRLSTTEMRFASFRGDDLVLTTDPDQGGRYEIVWRK